MTTTDLASLFLIAHKVRGQPAFDVAQQMPCPTCHGVGYPDAPEDWPYPVEGCDECNGEGFWWITPTSGHRAYPYWHYRLHIEMCKGLPGMLWVDHAFIFDLPADWPDHYAYNDPSKPTLDLRGLGLIKPKAPPTRRPLK